MARAAWLAVACLLTVVPSAAPNGPAVWRYTFEAPPDGWLKPDFDDSSWKQGPAGFGAGNAPGGRIRTTWDTPEIWARREVTMPERLPDGLRLWVHHDEDAEVYVNGVLAAKLTGYRKDYTMIDMTADARAALRPGRNVLAAHCRQTRGGQYLDVAIVSRRPEASGARPKAKAKAKRPAADGGRGPVEQLMTRWAKSVTPANAWAEHPRPQMVRKDWLNLNGLWEYAIEGAAGPWTGGRVTNAEFDPLSKLTAKAPAKWGGKVLVPFCVESALSGVGKLVRPNQLLWYRRTFAVPGNWADRRVLLHFEAVDWHARAWVNGVQVGEHRGGYDPFSFDLTDALPAGKGNRHELVVVVWDPTNMGDQPVGKQALPELRRGFRYTPTTGIWQTVWLEAVPKRWRIDDLRLTPDVDNQRLLVHVDPKLVSRSHAVDVAVLDGEKEVARGTGLAGTEVSIPSPRLWSPDDPFLYNLRITLRHYQDANQIDDEVASYVGMRKVSLARDDAGFTRICLNAKPIFQVGPLDQGYWPDGILTPPSDAAAAFDVQFLKLIACNMARVHVKVHPRRWYYHCDRLGLLVWQDMVCTRKFDPKISPASAAQFEAEMKAMIDHLANHPSIVQWVVFNEGWGQYDTERLTKWVKDYDPTRLVDNASGWADKDCGDVLDEHDYTFHPSIPVPQTAAGRALVLGECGGLNRQIDGHVWYPQQKSPAKIDYVGEPSRMTFETPEQMEAGYEYWVDGLWQMRHAQGLCAAVYTQITDVEHELNGWLTYDRAVPKFDPKRIAEMHRRLFAPAPKTRAIVPPGAAGPQEWKYTTDRTTGNWFMAGYDDAGWRTGRTPFGKLDVPGLSAATPWEAGDLYLRKPFTLEELPKRATLRVMYRRGCKVYLNGHLVKSLHGPDRDARIRAHDIPLRPETVALLREGPNVLALHCPAYAPPTYLDVALLGVGE